MKIKKINSKIISQYFIIFFICVVLSFAKINDISPFLYAFFFACIFVGIDEKLLAIFTVASAVFSSPTLETFFVALTVVSVGIISFYLHRLLKKNIHIVIHFITFLISLTTYIYYNYSNIKNLLWFIFLGLISLYVMIVVMQVISLKKNCFKLTLDESICFLFFIAILGAGLASVRIGEFYVYRLFLAFLLFILLSTRSYSLIYSIVISFAFGVGLYDFSLFSLAEFVLLALIAGIFTPTNKVKIVISVVLTDIFVRLCFFETGFSLIYQVLPIAIAGIVYLIMLNKKLNSLTNLVYVKKSEIASRNVINTTRRNIKKRISELSNVFLDMKHLHLNMIKKQLNKEELMSMLSREILSTCCKDCLDKNRCTRSIGTDNKSNIETLVNIAINKGKVTLLDIPSGLTNRCSKVNNLVSLINRLSDEYRQYKNMLADVNNVKILLADQMGAVSQLLLDIGSEIDTNVTFDVERENKIISRLMGLNIECREVLLYTEKNDEMSAVLIVKTDDTTNEIIEKVVSETLKMSMQVVSVTPNQETSYCTVNLKRKSKYDCIFGLASCNKSGNDESGDCHSIIRLGADKFLLALCDGMGAGKTAHKTSAMTLGLIENFYKVGFENEIILESVNKLLAVNNQENYSTLDVCLLDLNKEIADFIKVGAPVGFIKRESNLELVEGGALPIGALDSITPATYKTTISTKDIIVMVTDGITDAFETTENFENFVMHLASNNPQTLAETILDEALRLNNMSAKDDMTVLVARTYLKN